MTGLHIDRPCQVRQAAPGRWEWTCLCSPAVWPCTGRETTFDAAIDAADSHLTTAHATTKVGELAVVIDLAAYRTTTLAKTLVPMVAGGPGFGGEAA